MKKQNDFLSENINFPSLNLVETKQKDWQCY